MKRGSARARPRVGVRLRSGFGLGVGFGRAKAGAALARSQGRSRRGPGYVDWGWASARGSVVESATAEWSGFLLRAKLGLAETANRTRRLRMFLVRVPSATTAWTSAAEHAPSGPAISIAAQASQHSQSAMAYARLLSARVWRAAPSAQLSAADAADFRA